MFLATRRAWMVGFGVLAGCGAPPLPREPAAPAPVVARVAAEAPAAPDVSPVAEPEALLFVARWKSPTKGVDETLKLLGVPVAIEALAAAELGPAWGLVDLDASVDAALSLDPKSTDDEPKALAAVSIPLRSFDEARERIDKEGTPLVTVRPGVLRMSAKQGDKATCELSASPATSGPARARIVCGAGARDLDALGGWLARTLARTPPETNDLVATLRARPLKDRYLGPLRTKATELGEQARAALATQSVSDPDISGAPAVILDESLRFLEDVDSVELRTSVGGAPPQMVAGGALRFAGTSSWLTHVLTDANAKAGPAPAMFWQAPRDASAATWGRGNDPRLYDGVLRVLHKALAIGLARAPISAADKEAVDAFVTTAPRTPAAWVSAQGLVHGSKKPPAKAARTPAEALADMKALAVSTLGWTIFGVEAPSAEYVAWAKQGVDLYGRAVRAILDLAAASKSKKGGDRELRELLPRVAVVNAPPGWPRGTVAFDAHVSFDSKLAAVFLPGKKEAPSTKEVPTKEPPAVKGSVTLRLAIVPDGDHTWVGVSADLDELKKRMNAAMSGAPKEGTLAARDGLSGLKETGQTWGGFFSVGELVERVLEELVKEKPEHAEDVRAVLAALPNRARTPILMVGSGAAGPAPSNAAEVRLQAGTLADVAGLVWFLFSPRGRALLKTIDAKL